MKKAYKVLSVLMIVLMVVATCTNVFAKVDVNQIKSDGNTGADNTIQNIGSTILSIITGVGMVLAVVLVAVLGIKYMMGSTEEKSEYKKSMIPYLVGAVLVFGASAIGKAVVGFGSTITGN